MLLFCKLVDETQMAAPQEYTDAFIITKKLFLGGLPGLQSNSKRYERPCKNRMRVWSKIIHPFICSLNKDRIFYSAFSPKKGPGSRSR